MIIIYDIGVYCIHICMYISCNENKALREILEKERITLFPVRQLLLAVFSLVTSTISHRQAVHFNAALYFI